ncbi:beta-propeller fold lactonase family protein [candidate division KSB1 bacterium]|nr:beta-propeller fold lactonase family protein [candidate division KSB1 bacterium]
MRLIAPVIMLIVVSCSTPSGQGHSTLADIEAKRIHLPNGWGITPIGKSLPLGDLPLNIAVSPSGKMLAVTNNGQSDQSIQLIDVDEQALVDSLPVGKAWIGLTFSDDGKSLYASGGNDNWILKLDVDNRLHPLDTLRIGEPWPEKIAPAGIALDDDRKVLYTVTTENNSLYVIDIDAKKEVQRFPLGGEGYTCLLSPDRKILYISCWGCDKVQMFDTESRQFAGSIDVGDNPNDMCLSKDGSHLFVANANDNSISVIDLKQRRVIEVLNAALYPEALPGATTNSVALSENGKTLYIANADNNCIAVFDVSQPGSSVSKGFIPAGWYPTCIRVVDENIYVANGKGFSSFANPGGPNPAKKKQEGAREEYIAGLFRGTLSIIPVPDEEQLSVYSQVVYHNTPYSKELEDVTEGQTGNPIPHRVGDASPIEYIFYILKENRTYDQVLGDIPAGNGDTTLVLFGEKITPNQHALAQEFVLLDNFYVDGEVSADGHNWSTGAYATDFLEKNWPTSYGGRGGGYYGEGTREIANNKNGFIWDACKKYGVTYRSYGEFVDDYKPNIPVLKEHFCPYFTGWDQSVPDTTRFRQWKRDFDSLLTINSLPQLNTLRFINDHTEGLSKGKPTPFAHVADNDLAVGLFVEYLSHSPVWQESVVFIVEDDAQNGPDHVDAHRTTAYVAGGYVKRGYIDHTMYSTSSMLRTIELILGLPPMTQYDAAATPMWRCFADTANGAPFTARPANIDLSERNIAVNKWQRMSEEFNFAKEDRAPDAPFNQVLWAAVKGEESVCPPPVHAAFLKASKDDNDTRITN